MQKVLAIGSATARQAPPPAEGRVVEFPSASERTGRTFVCSVLFLDIVEYSKKPIGEQLQTKERFNARVSQAIAEVPAEDRIILDTGDGVAISFLGDPEDALCVALALAPALSATAEIPARIGINLGPVRLTHDINGQPNIIGDGINVAQRVMSFARPGHILVSRGYHEVLTRIVEDYAGLFAYQGSRTDKHVREHEIFELVAPIEQASAVAEQRKLARRRKNAAARAGKASGPRLLSNRGLAYAVTAGSSVLLVAAIVSTFQSEAPPKPTTATVTHPRVAAPATVPVPTEPSAQATPEPPSVPAPGKTTAAVQPKVASAAPTAHKSAPASPAQGPAGHVALPASRETNVDSGGESKTAGPGLWRPDAPPPAAKATSGPTAFVVLAISPWGEVFVDGKSMGVSPPLAELALTPGKHRIVVRNGGFKPFRDDVELGSNETIRIKHKFVQAR